MINYTSNYEKQSIYFKKFVRHLISPRETESFPGGSVVKNPPARQETWVPSLGHEDPLEKDMATHRSILAWEIPCTGEPGGVRGAAELDTTW